MGGSFTPELVRLLVDAGCRFERHGKGDHDIRIGPIVECRFVVERHPQHKYRIPTTRRPN